MLRAFNFSTGTPQTPFAFPSAAPSARRGDAETHTAETPAPREQKARSDDGAAVPAPGRADGFLTNDEKRRLLMASKDAFRAQAKLGSAAETPTAGLSEDDWRHQQVYAAAGVHGLREARHRDFRAILARFLHLSGKHTAAYGAEIRSGGAIAGADQALYLLEAACRKWGLSFPAYPEAICQRQYKCALSAATARQLSQMLYTINNRGRAKKGNAAAHLPAPEGMPDLDTPPKPAPAPATATGKAVRTYQLTTKPAGRQQSGGECPF